MSASPDIPGLFSELKLREATFPNRVWVAPMCQYSAVDGVIGDWHLAHLGGLAIGKPGLIMAEATAVAPEGRISVACPGLWTDEQARAWERIVRFCHSLGVPMGIQLAHAGRKGSTLQPWRGGLPASAADGGWQTVGPSPLAFGSLPIPRELNATEFTALIDAFAAAARRAAAAGFDTVELHMAHGYLLHQFLSPLSNQRTDEFGGSLTNRMRLPLAVASAVREAFPAERPVFVRISSTDWVPAGWDVEQSIEFVRELTARGIDLIDASSGGLDPAQQIPRRVDYQIANAARIKAATDATVAAVGLITQPAQAAAIIAEGRADAVLLARQMLRDPHWPLRAAHELGVKVAWVPQYSRALPWP